MTTISHSSRQQPIPGRGGAGDLGSPQTWERVPLASFTTHTGRRTGHTTIAGAKSSVFKKPEFESATDFQSAIMRAADRAKANSRFGASTVEGILQAFDGRLYITTLQGRQGVPVMLEGDGGIFNRVQTRVDVQRLHPALQAVVSAKSMIDLRADLPLPIPPGGSGPYTPVPGSPQLPVPQYPGPYYPPTNPHYPPPHGPHYPHDNGPYYDEYRGVDGGGEGTAGEAQPGAGSGNPESLKEIWDRMRGK